MAAQAMRGQFRGHGWFFYLLLLGIMAPGILVGFGFAIMMRCWAWNCRGTPRRF
jgi:putative spermidine/putrescine transport system permease protein